MKNITIIGSTGSIGKNALNVVSSSEGALSVFCLAARSNDKQLLEQALLFRPKIVVIFDDTKRKSLQKELPFCRVLSSHEGIAEACRHQDVDVILNAASGVAGLIATKYALESGKTLALANKESLVAAGSLVMEKARLFGSAVIPVDSEHSALFQCLLGEDISKVRRLILTASGGPFRNLPLEKLQNVGVEEALQHPTWSMGAKNSIDSSTLMNKGLEVIEAQVLFSLPLEKIEVVVHPQSIVHGMVEFIDGSLKAQFSSPTMQIPIRYALSYPERVLAPISSFDFKTATKWEFGPPDLDKFPCLRIAMEAAASGKSMPCFMNAANEVLVRRFLDREIRWVEIGEKLESLLDGHKPYSLLAFEDVDEVQREAFEKALLC